MDFDVIDNSYIDTGSQFQQTTVEESSFSLDPTTTAIMASQQDCETRVKLIVRFIPDQLVQNDVHALFSSIGPVETIKVITNKRHGHYAFVAYYRPEDAQNAINQLDGYGIFGKSIRVSFAQNDQVEQSLSVDVEKSNLIVNYLPLSMNEAEMRSIFAPIGEMQHCKIVIDVHTGRSLSYGFVKYNRPEDARKAIELINGLKVQNKRLKVSYARPNTEETKGASLYVNNLPRDASQEDVEGLFRSYGQVISCRILRDNYSWHQYALCSTAENSLGISKGTAFVLYDKRSEAETAIKMLSGAFYRGKILLVKFAKIDPPFNRNRNTRRRLPQLPPPCPNYVPYNAPIVPYYQSTEVTYTRRVFQSWTILVHGLHLNANETTLLHMFGQFGYIQNVRIVRDSYDYQCRGFGFVEMNNFVEASNAVQHLNGSVFQGLPLHVRFTGWSTQLQADENWVFGNSNGF